jgi:prevent-host-death family protein
VYTYPAREAKNSFSTLLEMAALGHEIRITKHGHEIAKLVSSTTKILKDATSKMTVQMSQPSHDLAVTSDAVFLGELTAIRAKVRPASTTEGVSDSFTWQSARDEGRRA